MSSQIATAISAIPIDSTAKPFQVLTDRSLCACRPELAAMPFIAALPLKASPSALDPVTDTETISKQYWHCQYGHRRQKNGRGRRPFRRWRREPVRRRGGLRLTDGHRDEDARVV